MKIRRDLSNGQNSSKSFILTQSQPRTPDSEPVSAGKLPDSASDEAAGAAFPPSKFNVVQVLGPRTIGNPCLSGSGSSKCFILTHSQPGTPDSEPVSAGKLPDPASDER